MPSIHLHGNNSDIDVGTVETIWSGGGRFVWALRESTLRIVSTSSDDDVDGVGAKTVCVTGLDFNWNPISSTVEMKGIIPVSTGRKFLRINDMKVVTAGSPEDTNLGTIAAIDIEAEQVARVIPEGKGKSLATFYSVPANSVFDMHIVFVSPFIKAGNGSYRVTLRTRKFGEAWHHEDDYGGSSSGAGIQREYKPPFRIQEKTDFEFLAEVMANNSEVSVDISGHLKFLK